MKTVGVITTSRADYSYLRWVIKSLKKNGIDVRIIVTGSHLSKKYGFTITEILRDFTEISARVNIRLDNSSEKTIAESMGRCTNYFAKVFSKIPLDLIVVLGDRYELLPICSTALVMNIPIVHISGGDITLGAIDNSIRNAITMMATYHFPETEESKRNIIRMIGNKENIYNIGSLSLDAYNYEQLLDRKNIACKLKLKENVKWIMLTFHPETKSTIEYNVRTVNHIMRVLLKEKGQIIVSKSNADLGGIQINEVLEAYQKENPNKVLTYDSLGQLLYMSILKQVDFVIGNSSSGIVETPLIGVPTINVGSRQKGRHLCSNIIQTDSSIKNLSKAIKLAHNMKGRLFTDRYYWGDGHSSDKFSEILLNILNHY